MGHIELSLLKNAVIVHSPGHTDRLIHYWFRVHYASGAAVLNMSQYDDFLKRR
jgi:hypothetical protein